MNQKKVRFEYYHVVFRKKEDRNSQRDRLFDLVQWIAKAKQKSLEARTYNYRQEQARLDDTYWDDELKFYFLHFLRLRDTIPATATVTTKVEPLELQDDEYIGEEASALYDELNHVLMLQRNKYSLGPEGIEEYLNILWDTDDERIFLRPICPPNVFEMAKKSTEYRKINLRFADLKTVESSERLIDKFKSPLGPILSHFEKFDGVNAQITITVGNTKSSLNAETISDTLSDIEENSEYFSRAELVRRPEEDDTRVELIDLFAHKAHDFCTFRMERREHLSHHAIAKEMWTIYSANEDCKNRQRVISSYLRN